MEPADLPADVIQFIRDRIDSVAELEALLLLFSEQRAWSVTELTQRLYVTPQAAAAALGALGRRGLVTAEQQGYRFDRRNEALPQVEHLREAYRNRLTQVTRLIHAKPSAAVRNFARAFDIKGKT